MSSPVRVSGPPSLRQLARMAGVSPATVSRVLSDDENVSPELRAKVRSAADSIGFRRAAINRVALGGRTDSVGILIPNLGNSYFTDIVQGLQNTLLQHDILPMVLTSKGEDRRCVRRLLDHRVDAMVLALTDETLHEGDFLEVQRSGVPFLLFGATHPEMECDLLECDEAGGGYLAGKHLVELGHRRLGFVYYGEGHSSCDQRLIGFRRALEEYGAQLLEQDIAHNPVRRTEPERLELLHADIHRILTKESRPTAIFAPSDFLATEVYRVARRVGLSIPRDLSVVGFANLDFSSLVDPPLTTIRQDGIAMGEAAGVQVLRRLKHPDAETFHQVQPVELIVRESTAVP